jgi:16S rRNA (uracil1498-N3)-methyltransferase
MRRRFFVHQFDGSEAFLCGDTANHLIRVLRAQPGQIYELSDGERVQLGRIERIGRGSLSFKLVGEVPAGEPRLRATLLLAIVKFDRFEWAVEKATELGVNEIVPLAAERSEKGLVAAAAKRVERWRKIALESAQQSRRLKPPVIAPPIKAAETFPLADASIKLLLSEERNAPPLPSVLRERREESIALAIGPEGGWTENEFAIARSCGFLDASLGEHILRTETAVVAALAMVSFALDARAMSRNEAGN